MRVKLIAKTITVDNIPGYNVHPDNQFYPTDADDLAEQAGRLCYEAWVRLNPKTVTNQGYIKNILDLGHYSVLEHSSASFYIDGVTRAFLLELERHRHLSYSVVSQRYVPGSRFGFVMHPVLELLGDETKARIAELDMIAHKLYDDIIVELLPKLEGTGELHKIGKIARGAARNVLPEGTETRLLVSGNMRAWLEVLWKRITPSADQEICEVSRLILNELMTIAPNTCQDLKVLTSSKEVQNGS